MRVRNITAGEARARLGRLRGLRPSWSDVKSWRPHPARQDGGRDLGSRELADVRRTMQECLEGRGGEVSARARAAELSGIYAELSLAGRERFVTLLADDFGVDNDAVLAAARNVIDAQSQEERDADVRVLRDALQAPWLTLLRQFNVVSAGTSFLVELRADLMRFERDNERLVPLEQDLRALLASWFDIGFLELRRITWDSPASLLEKLAQSEAVHAVAGWEDLKNRLEPDRRIFGFFHPRLPDEPIIFVEVALVSGLAGAIEPLLDPTGPPTDLGKADTAIFYSISNAHPGLAGISFGSVLIKQVVDALAEELPQLRTFATLSPVPGFRSWLDRRLADRPDGRELRAALESENASRSSELAATLRMPLLRLCAEYLLTAKRSDGRALDLVANFHLGNGARIERLNWLADTSEQGLRESAGIMVNYLYSLRDIDANHEAYVSDGVVSASSAVARLARES